jgi:hypothetical protein
MWGFFLSSSSILKDFRKNTICHAMKCIIGKLIFRKDFYMQD